MLNKSPADTDTEFDVSLPVVVELLIVTVRLVAEPFLSRVKILESDPPGAAPNPTYSLLITPGADTSPRTFASVALTVNPPQKGPI